MANIDLLVLKDVYKRQIMSLEQYKLTLQALVSDSCSLFDFQGFNACDLDPK